MSVVIPIGPPDSFYKGDTVKWRFKPVADYAPGLTFTMKYDFVTDGDKKGITCTDNGDGTWLATLSAAVSNTFRVGHYRLVGYVTDGTDRYTLDRGGFDVEAEFDQRVAGFDGRSHVRKTLANIEALIESRMGNLDDLVSFSVQGRSSTVMQMDELVTLRSQYIEFVRQEKAQENVDKGLGSGNKILTRFNR